METPGFKQRIARYIGRALRHLLFLAIAGAVALWGAGFALTHPAQRDVGQPPPDLPAQTIVFPSASGQLVHGWLVPGIKGQGAILLLHGVRANRLSMLGRARFLHASGYAVLLIDFQASGESPGQAISFGYREAGDIEGALRYLREAAPGERVGIVATSMGGAASLLAEPLPDVDAIVLEQVYPTIEQALKDRLKLHLGVPGTWLAPLMLATLPIHLGISPAQLRPIDRIGRLQAPKLLIAGDQDQHTLIDESRAMFEAAAEPKEFWVVEGAAHVDLYRYAGGAYEQRVGCFLGRWLRDEVASSKCAFVANR
ncbi:alpha/beta hydrolase [Dyella subtropica]|uniref:alpha/beta hydrolase n=1 Tax=Dyella subtropica TaxID=2992127 RepID=UPI00225915FA|nr:alpha/beta hydrolase [Dyella subtropica]